MKRLLLVLAALLLISFSLVGCDRVESAANGDTPMPGNVFSSLI